MLVRAQQGKPFMACAQNDMAKCYGTEQNSLGRQCRKERPRPTTVELDNSRHHAHRPPRPSTASPYRMPSTEFGAAHAYAISRERMRLRRRVIIRGLTRLQKNSSLRGTIVRIKLERGTPTKKGKGTARYKHIDSRPDALTFGGVESPSVSVCPQRAASVAPLLFFDLSGLAG